MTAPPRVSVIVPTRNRARRLEGLLDNLARLTPVPDLAWEVVVVDNGSEDDTPDVVRRGRARYLAEPRAGRSHALNAGVAGTASELLLFLDDDVAVEPQWLDEMVRTVSGPRVVAAGGRILPEFDGGPPAWLPSDLPFPYRFDLGDAPTDAHTVFGANMAFRRSAFERYGLFRTDLGILPGNPLVGEESEFCSRLVAGGERIAYAPRAVVHHPVTREQASLPFLLRWHYHYGRSQARREPPPPGTTWWWRAPRYLWRELVTATLSRWLARDRGRRIRERLRVRRVMGQIVEYRRIFDERHTLPGGGPR